MADALQDMTTFMQAAGGFAQAVTSLYDAKVQSQVVRRGVEIDNSRNAFLMRFSLPPTDPNRITTENFQEALDEYNQGVAGSIDGINEGLVRERVRGHFQSGENAFNLAMSKQLFSMTANEVRTNTAVSIKSVLEGVGTYSEKLARLEPILQAAKAGGYYSPIEFADLEDTYLRPVRAKAKAESMIAAEREAIARGQEAYAEAAGKASAYEDEARKAEEARIMGDEETAPAAREASAKATAAARAERDRMAEIRKSMETSENELELARGKVVEDEAIGSADKAAIVGEINAQIAARDAETKSYFDSVFEQWRKDGVGAPDEALLYLRQSGASSAVKRELGARIEGYVVEKVNSDMKEYVTGIEGLPSGVHTEASIQKSIQIVEAMAAASDSSKVKEEAQTQVKNLQRLLKDNAEGSRAQAINDAKLKLADYIDQISFGNASFFDVYRRMREDPQIRQYLGGELYDLARQELDKRGTKLDKLEMATTEVVVSSLLGLERIDGSTTIVGRNSQLAKWAKAKEGSPDRLRFDSLASDLISQLRERIASGTAMTYAEQKTWIAERLVPYVRDTSILEVPESTFARDAEESSGKTQASIDAGKFKGAVTIAPGGKAIIPAAMEQKLAFNRAMAVKQISENASGILTAASQAGLSGAEVPSDESEFKAYTTKDADQFLVAGKLAYSIDAEGVDGKDGIAVNVLREDTKGDIAIGGRKYSFLTKATALAEMAAARGDARKRIDAEARDRAARASIYKSVQAGLGEITPYTQRQR